MRIYGLDFTSAPGRAKPITCAACDLEGHTLNLRALERFETFETFEAFLRRGGGWVAGFDFPFGQPRKLIANLGWPATWEGYVAAVASGSLAQFAETLAAYRSLRPPGDKQHLRQTDVIANARSPMMLYGVPVGRMFFQGAPRLLRSPLSILPCRPTADRRIALETYPRLVANRWIDARQGYKQDDPRRQTSAQRYAREAIVLGLRGDLRRHYGVALELDDTQIGALIDDGSGDTLDGVLCAAQAAWAYTQRDQGYGVPAACDPIEGWIVDPALMV
ncbi:MAG: DUF429 domain-containing protein [Kouleothrix sp.]|nr:DUF429 domain-containing protein [Kouleothrix sp.]